MEGVVSTSGQHGAENGTGDDPQKVDAGAEDAGSIREKQSRHRDESPRRRDGSPKRKADSPRRSDDQKKDTSRNGDDRSHRRDHRSDRDSHRDSHRDRDDRHRKREDVRDRDRDRGRREDADRRRPEDDRRRERDDNRRRDRQDDRRGDDRRGGGDDRRSDRGRPRRDDNRDHDWRRDERPPGDRREPERRAGVEEEEEGAVAMPAYVEPTVPEASGPAREPQSLELMMALQVKAAQAESKPVFLSKAQRAELALEKRRAEVAEQRAQERLEREAREKEEREARERPREREWDRERREAERKEREKRNQEEKEKRSGARLNDNELIQIKRDYLGFKPPKKTFVKNSDKFRFNFDWGKDEDTSVDNNPLYAKRFDYKPQFGRGYIGGIDQKAQIREYMKGLDKKQGPGSKNIEAVNFERTELDAKSSRLDKLDRHEIHWSEKSLDKMSERDWRIFREDHNMQVRGTDVPAPVRNWAESGLPEQVLAAIKDAGYEKPTAIQMQALSLGRQARDVLGVAATGSGKTAAFVLPMLLYLQSLPPLTPERIPDGPYALILAPTRELAQQTEAAARSFGAPLGFRVLSIIGGVSIEEQGFALQRGIEIVVATPGRLLDCINSRYMALNQCNYIVLDEADKMIDMGFEASFQYSHQQGDIRLILDSMPATSMKSEDEAVAKQQEADIAAGRLVLRHTTMYSATMPPQVEILARTYLRHPVTVHIGKIAEPITQAVVFVKGDSDRTGKLQRLLADSQPPIIVFVNQKKTVESLGRVLEKQGWACARLHSGRSQEQRTEALESFRQGTADILVATDVAARGIDIPGVTHVIQYNVPKDIEAYTHRIGRTGRAGQTGLATLLLSDTETEIMYDLRALLEKGNQRVPPELRDNPASSSKAGSGVVPRKRRDTVIFTN